MSEPSDVDPSATEVEPSDDSPTAVPDVLDSPLEVVVDAVVVPDSAPLAAPSPSQATSSNAPIATARHRADTQRIPSTPMMGGMLGRIVRAGQAGGVACS